MAFAAKAVSNCDFSAIPDSGSPDNCIGGHTWIWYGSNPYEPPDAGARCGCGMRAFGDIGRPIDDKDTWTPIGICHIPEHGVQHIMTLLDGE